MLITNEPFNQYDKFADFEPEKSALHDIESVLNYADLNRARQNRADKSVIYQPGLGVTKTAPAFSGPRASLGEFIVNDGDKLDPLISFLIKSHFCRT